VPFHEAKWALSGNLVTSFTSASSPAAPEGPIPCRLVKVGGHGCEQPVQFFAGFLLPAPEYTIDRPGS
jgi:hypothetical protein